MNHRCAKSIAAMLVGLSLSACMSYNGPYVGPADGPRARLRLSTDGSIRLIPNSACVNWKAPGTGVAVYRQSAVPLPLSSENNGASLGMPYPPAPGNLLSSELYVRADQPIVAVYMKHTKTTVEDKKIITHQCGGVFTFTPQIDKDYIGVFTAIEGGDRCIRTIMQAGDQPTLIKNEYIPSVCEK